MADMRLQKPRHVTPFDTDESWLRQEKDLRDVARFVGVEHHLVRRSWSRMLSFCCSVCGAAREVVCRVCVVLFFARDREVYRVE